ncbi:MAG: MBL fold metallo-hydrolase [Sphingobacteriia bacterium 24-36-13]|jgi:phosphoribosyl 1,2-cyclic phosphodiesterase|uniref:MBL fold metallo-hydrolase n=1 Tax=Sediminibacterium sp. TaxID=1917865 RepID=UPI000BD8563E|nr:MBL fold metallo-hydrolase [Sediminibacterium sp.]OYY09918.1 MAG: MBL fold metallo-hydrolase [Sphingobacteriia bacterium 35-36-14]OYZ53927.1 MAG: MBL fold metallo-hydrolase [Sphingobacteriia bacterium 24-36-13]OZA63681.1 MAG: MBL fold metallo-hydrolase [Sphingobacteriia bacterium 39-36-14]HQS24899.1 MBL fold metallo-hydrolase [Sediminibacterium sp.]HQS35327.1 MBL fold metallo-hydrolase [Sediminibacterium sp.]
MSLQIASLNSGSNGNCYYIGNSTDAVLVDIGLSLRETEIRMKQLNLSVEKLRAIFISHEHTDHIKGLSTFANKYKIPIYITPETAKGGPKLIRHLSKPFEANQPIYIGKDISNRTDDCLAITPFIKEHDAADPHSFIISYQGIHVGVITDIGISCNNVTHYFQQCHAAFLESNYDEVLLKNGRYSQPLKERISNGKGHISNRQALDLFKNYRPKNMSHLLLAHLSKENNSPELALQTFLPHAEQTAILIASRYAPSPLIEIAPVDRYELQLLHKPKPIIKATQGILFG